MTLHACWVDAGNDANTDLLRKHQIDSPFFDARDPRITSAYLAKLATDEFHPGLYYASSWYPALTATGFAEHVSDDLKRIGWQGNPSVILDIETHDIGGYVIPALTKWRSLRPTRLTIFTLEGFQGGLFNPAQAQAINALKVYVGPQLYVDNTANGGGPMDPHPHSPVIDLLMAGFDGTRIVGFYDAAHLPYRWSGVAFSMGRLPT